MPETDWQSLDTGIYFLERQLPTPLLISCMTGGAQDAYAFNKELALAAENLGCPIGTGSIRVLLRHPDFLPDFCLKSWAPSVPLLANIGATVVRDESTDKIFGLLQKMEADAIVVHLNPGQELFQEDGDRDFRGVRQALRTFIQQAPVPVIVKETGFGLAPDEVACLLDAGAAYIDIAGSGGTNWILVEAYRHDTEKAADQFSDWGYPTATLLGNLRQHSGRIIASGGIRSGLDCAKALALGALACGVATPLARAVRQGGHEAVVKIMQDYIHTLKIAMMLTGCQSLADLRKPGILVAG